jgi:two-component system response regulator AtoC
MQALFDKVRKVASSKTTILVTGESGTGKELFARAIHYQSQRRDRAFVAINCGAIPENLLESELFGHVRGAFTGATGHKRGLFEEASGGTIFLDEIGELPLALQVKLLRVLQEEEIRKVGDTRTIKINARVIAATARNLEEEVRQGRFREELFYRLNVVTVNVPPLRERREDIPLLLEHYTERFSLANNRPAREPSPSALQMLLRYDWPGNVRELVNVIEQAVLLSEGERVEPVDLPETLHQGRTETDSVPIEGFDLKRNRAVFERHLISDALRECGGSRTRAAQLLGISLRSLMYKMKEYGVDREGGG